MAIDGAFGREQVISSEELAPYLTRNNCDGLIQLAGHMALMVGTGFLIYCSLDSAWVWAAMLAHGIVLAFLFAPVHECSHRTPFKSRRLNDTVYWLVALIYLVPPNFFRYAHATHHKYTQIRGWDPDMVLPRQATLWHYLYYVSAFPFFKRNLLWLLRHAGGRITPSQRYYLPANKDTVVIGEARIIWLIYGAIATTAFWFESWAPVTYWLLPRLMGEPVMRWLRIAEHGECPETPDLRENTRTTYAPRWLHFLFWNMSYHAEHHLSPMVPFHALPRFHERVKDEVFPAADSYGAVHADVLRKITSGEGVTWEAGATHSTD